MSSNLPAELWLSIFSYLELEDLSRTRRVCKTWWELINCDRLWKPRLLERGITLDSIKLENNDESEQVLANCQWAKICWSFYDKLAANWQNLRYKRDRVPRSTDRVVVWMPYILRTFYPWKKRGVEVLRAVNGNFVVVERLPLPEEDEFEECYEPHMTTDSVFALTNDNITIIFKLDSGSFRFATALAMTANGAFISCSNTEDLSHFMSKRQMLGADLLCCAVTENVIWFLEQQGNDVYVWDYTRSQLLLEFRAPRPVNLLSSENHVFITSRDMFSIYSINGERIWHRESLRVCGICWNKFGCGFIETEDTNSTKKAIYLTLPKLSLTKLDTGPPLALSLHETEHLAYCMYSSESSINLACVSLLNGTIMWDSVCSSCQSVPNQVLNHSILNEVVKMSTVLGKYVAVLGVDGDCTDSPESFISREDFSLYSCSDGEFIWSIRFSPYMIQYLSDQVIVTRKPGSRKFKYFHNFL